MQNVYNNMMINMNGNRLKHDCLIMSIEHFSTEFEIQDEIYIRKNICILCWSYFAFTTYPSLSHEKYTKSKIIFQSPVVVICLDMCIFLT